MEFQVQPKKRTVKPALYHDFFNLVANEMSVILSGSDCPSLTRIVLTRRRTLQVGTQDWSGYIEGQGWEEQQQRDKDEEEAMAELGKLDHNCNVEKRCN